MTLPNFILHGTIQKKKFYSHVITKISRKFEIRAVVEEKKIKRMEGWAKQYITTTVR